MWRIAAAFSVALGLALPAVGVAADSQKPAFDKVDVDSNGKVTVEEAAKAGVAKDKAKRQDLDDDGKLTQNDWKYIGYGSSSG